MKTIRTAKIKVKDAPSIFDDNCSKFLAACNWASKIVFKTKDTNWVSLSKKHYATVRSKFGLTSQLSLSVFRHVAASYSSMKSQKRWELATYRHPTFPVVWKRDFSMSTKGVRFWKQPVQLIHPGIPPVASWRGSKLKKVNNTWYLVLTYEIEIPETKEEGCIVGVDSGIKRLFTATNSSNSKTFTFKGGELNHRRYRIRFNRAEVQTVGTRSSHRLLKRMSGNEAAVTEHLLHVASKRLVAWSESVGARRIVMENLVDIRTASIEKGRRFRNSVHRWPYATGQFFVSYKAAAKGIGFETVNPRNTSRGCPCCGHVEKSNRRGLVFRCVACGRTGDADRIASINIRNRSVFGGHILPDTGSSKPPEGSEPLEVVSGCHDSSSDDSPNRSQSRFTAKTQPSLVVG